MTIPRLFHRMSLLPQLNSTQLNSTQLNSTHPFYLYHYIRLIMVSMAVRTLLFLPPLLRMLSFSPNHYSHAWSMNMNINMNGPASRRRVLHQTMATSISLVLLPPALPTQARNLPEDNGANLSNVGSVEALIPIINMEQLLLTLQSNNSTPIPTLVKALILPAEIPTTEQDFKKLFDSYSNPVSYKQKFRNNNAFLVYYTQGYDGPNRANIEDLSNSELLQQSQYGARNECWVAWSQLMSEVVYANTSGDTSELLKMLHATIRAFDTYIALAPNQMEARTMWTEQVTRTSVKEVL